MNGNLSKVCRKGSMGEKGEKGDTPSVIFRLDENGNLYFSSDGILVDKEYVNSQNLVTKADIEALQESTNKLLKNAVTKKTTITLYESAWDGDNGKYTQVVKMPEGSVTANSQVDLQITDEQMEIFSEKDISFTVKNIGGTVTVNCFGVKPTQDYDVQVSIMEVEFI